MKVKVSYTLEYEKVPRLISKILSECCEKLLKNSKMDFSVHHIEDFIADVQVAQEDMSLVNSQLEDCVNLAIGYTNVMITKNNEAENNDEEPGPVQAESE